MASAGTVSVSFKAETQQFTEDLRKVQTSIGRLEKSFSGVEKIAGMAFRAISVEKLARFTKEALNAADATSEAAESIRQADLAVKQLTDSLQTYVQKFAAGLSIAILGPPGEIQKIDDQIDSLKARRDALLSGGGFRKGEYFVDAPTIRDAVASINAEIDKLLARQRALLNPTITADKNKWLPLPEDIEFSISAINALKIETDGVRQQAEAAATAYNNLALAVANAPIERMKEISSLVGAGYADAQAEFQQQISDTTFAQLDARMQAEQAAAEYRVDLEQRASEAITQIKEQNVGIALELLQTLGVKSKTFAIAAIVLEKALAIQRLLMANQVAAELAFASQLVAGVPATFATAQAAKAAVLAQGRIGALMIGATGALQIADRLSSSRSSIGTPTNPAYTTSSGLDDSTAQGMEPLRAIQVIIAGNVGFDQSVMNQIIAGIREAADDRDVIIFGQNSRQAQELLGQ